MEVLFEMFYCLSWDSVIVVKEVVDNVYTRMVVSDVLVVF